MENKSFFKSFTIDAEEGIKGVLLYFLTPIGKAFVWYCISYTTKFSIALTKTCVYIYVSWTLPLAFFIKIFYQKSHVVFFQNLFFPHLINLLYTNKPTI